MAITNTMKDSSRLTIRQALPHEADSLTELALRSKAYWPYDKKFLADCREALTMTGSRIESGLVYVAQNAANIIGFYAFSIEEGSPKMIDLFVEPEWIGKGVGFKLWRHALECARKYKWSYFILAADPFAAEKFYLKVGCRKIGEVESTVRPGRMLPVLRFDLN